MKCASLFAWRHPALAAGKIRMSPAQVKVKALEMVLGLSVEGLPYDKIPPERWPEVREFRKLRTGERIKAAIRWLSHTVG